MEQTILVTGSTSGFGRLMVETLARRGYRVFAGMRAVAGKNAPAAEELRALAQQEQLALHLVEIEVTDDRARTSPVGDLVLIGSRRLSELSHHVLKGSHTRIPWDVALIPKFTPQLPAIWEPSADCKRLMTPLLLPP